METGKGLGHRDTRTDPVEPAPQKPRNSQMNRFGNEHGDDKEGDAEHTATAFRGGERKEVSDQPHRNRDQDEEELFCVGPYLANAYGRCPSLAHRYRSLRVTAVSPQQFPSPGHLSIIRASPVQNVPRVPGTAPPGASGDLDPTLS